MGRLCTMWPNSTDMRWAVRWTSVIACTSSAALTLGVARVHAQTNSTATLFTFDKTLIRKETGFFRSREVGTLSVSATALTFRSAKTNVEIPLDSISEFQPVRGNYDGPWLIVRYQLGSLRRELRLGDGQGRVGKRSAGDRTVEMRDAIARVRGAERCPEPSSLDALVVLGRRFVGTVAKQGFPGAPARLMSDPNTTGMLVLDGDLDRKDLTGAALIREGDRPCIARSGSAGLKGTKGIILFTGLSPGRYVVRVVAEEHETVVGDGKGHLISSTDATLREAVDNSLEMNEYLRGLREPGGFRLEGQDLAVAIEAGHVRYLGRLHFKTWPGDLAVPVLEPDAVREQTVRGLVFDRFLAMSWTWTTGE